MHTTNKTAKMDTPDSSARDASLAAARARIRALESQLGVSASVGATARGATAVANAAELAATRAERDSLQASLEKAEKRALAASRQQRSERDRRAALAATLKQKEEELGRRAAQHLEATSAGRMLGRVGDAAAAAAEAAAPHRIGCALLRAELAATEHLAETTRETLQGDLFDALTRAAEAERTLSAELSMAERQGSEDAEARAQREAAAWQREAELSARLAAAQESSRAEARRAAALEAALAAEVEARRRDVRAAGVEAETLKAKFEEVEELERARAEAAAHDGQEQQAALAAELASQRTRVAEAEAALKKVKAAHAGGALPSLMLRLGARGVGAQGLRLVLARWREATAAVSLHSDVNAFKEEVKQMQGRLAMAKVQRQRAEETLSSKARKAEEEVQKKLVLAQRKLDQVEERRRFLELEMSSKSKEVDQVCARETPQPPARPWLTLL